MKPSPVNVAALVAFGLLFSVASRARADTNVFEFLTVGRETYTHARITSVTPGEAVILFDGGGARVALSNLPAWLQQRYNYDPQKAADFLAQQREKEAERQRQYQKRAAAQLVQEAVRVASAPTETIRVHEVTARSWGPGAKCRTDLGQVLIAGLPSQIGKYWEQVGNLKKEIADFEADIEAAESAARRASAVAPTGAGGSAAYVDAAMRQRARANLMVEDVRDAKRKLEKMRAALATLEGLEEEQTSILAKSKGERYDGMEVWRFTGMSPSRPKTP